MSDQLVYLQCSIKVLCVKKSVLQRVPYLVGLVNFENNGTHDNPAIIEGCSYKALKHILLSAESDFEVYYPEYKQEYEYLNIDTKPLIEKEKNIYPDGNIELGRIRNICRNDFGGISIKRLLQGMDMHNAKICIIVEKDDNNDITFDSGYDVNVNILTTICDYRNFPSLNDSMQIEKYEGYTKLYISASNVTNLGLRKFYLIPEIIPNPVKVYNLMRNSGKQMFDLNTEKSYMLISNVIIRLTSPRSSRYISINSFSLNISRECNSINVELWKYPNNPKFNIPGNVLNVDGLIYYDITSILKSHSELDIMLGEVNFENKKVYHDNVALLEL